MINEDRLINRFLKYVKIDSPTKSELKFASFFNEGNGENRFRSNNG